MCLVLTNPVEILAVQLVKQGIEAGGFCTGHPSNYYLLLSNPYITIHNCRKTVLMIIIIHYITYHYIALHNLR